METRSSNQPPAAVALRMRPGVRRVIKTVRRLRGGLAYRWISAPFRVARNALQRRNGQADYERWGGTQHLEEWWKERTERMARLIPAGSKVVEFGAGRRQLEKLLPPGTHYVPSDLVSRGPGTLVCDLNHRPLPELRPLGCDVAVFAGVFEYLNDVPGVVRWLANSGIQRCVASFDPMPAQVRWWQRRRVALRRSYFGYMNELTEAEFRAAFTTAGFVPTETSTWTTQVIMNFERRSK